MSFCVNMERDFILLQLQQETSGCLKVIALVMWSIIMYYPNKNVYKQSEQLMNNNELAFRYEFGHKCDPVE